MSHAFQVVGAAQSIPDVAGRVFAGFDYFREAMQHAYKMGALFEVRSLADGKTYNPRHMAGEQ